MLDLLVATGLAKSNREAREFLTSGAVSVNGEKVDPDASMKKAMLLHGSIPLIKRGKKAWHVARWHEIRHVRLYDRRPR